MKRNHRRPAWVLFGIGLPAILAAFVAYTTLVAPTQIALVNVRDFQAADFLEAAESRWCEISRFEVSELQGAKLEGFDAIAVFAHGLTISAEQKSALEEAAGRGVTLISFGENLRENQLDTLDDEALAAVDAYIENWSPANIASLLDFVRRDVDGKRLFAPVAAEAVEQPYDGLFHPETEDMFESVADFEDYYRQSGRLKEGAPRVALLSMASRTRSSARGVLDAIVTDLEARELNVYPIAGHRKRLEFLAELEPDLIVSLPHGRLVPGRGDQGVELLRELDAPMLAPITVNQDHAEWLNDQRSMTGGMLSQSVIMPEVDGGIDALTVGAMFENESGLSVLEPLEERIALLGERAARWLALRDTPNADKRVAIVYYKAAGQNALIASGLDVGVSLLTLLRELERQGYDTGDLPATSSELLERIDRQGPLVASYAKGRFEQLLEEGDPVRIPVGLYESWRRKSLPEGLIESMDEFYGPAPGEYMAARSEKSAELVVPRLRFGNVVLVPQPLSATIDDENRAVHGVRQPPPHAYVATYLWARHGFEADVLLHFGTHGSLEFTPRKQVALSPLDWPDALVGPLPHLYLYSVSDIGEAIIAKRRGYGALVSHLTPPFSEASLEDEHAKLHDRIAAVTSDLTDELRERYLQEVTDEVLRLELHRDLGFEGLETRTLSVDEVEVVHDYIHELDHSRITLGLHALGEQHSRAEIEETTRLIVVERLADVLARRAGEGGGEGHQHGHGSHAHSHGASESGAAHAATPRARASDIIDTILAGRQSPESFLSDEERALLAGDAASDEEQKSEARGLASELLETLEAIAALREALSTSPERELAAIVRGLAGRYTAPSSGGDPVGNPESIPTGRNMYGVRTERTPTEVAWESGKSLADQLLARRVAELGEFPKKIAFTLWAGEFVRSEGTNIAQVFHLLGVEPLRNSRGNVYDVRLIPAEELGRPRVDVIVQTSGQFRDVASSRISLIDRAVRLAAEAAESDALPNFVREGAQNAEAAMKERGVAPAEARRFSTARVFGGLDGEYGTGVMGLIEDGDSWEDESQIGARYLESMGVLYSEDTWAASVPGALEGALANTDTVVLGRTSNTWGPVSLDHVYEYVGGMSAAIREVTGQSPAAYFTDTRNRYRPRVQAAREAIWSESRTTLLNDKFVTALMEDGPSAAEVFAESFRNVFGWNATRPQDLDPQLWDRLHEVYVEDSLELGVRDFFETENPFALQEMSAVLLESHRKNYWNPGDAIIERLSELHAELVADHGAGCSGFVCNNAALRQSISERLDDTLRSAYDANLDQVLDRGPAESAEGMALEKETLTLATVTTLIKERMRGVIMLGVLATLVAGLLWFGARGKRRAASS